MTHRLFGRQLAQAQDAQGKIDVARLGDLVSAAYAEFERDRRRTDRSISLMIEELDQLTRGLEDVVTERTAVLREREGELEAQNLRFEAAVNNMSQALLLFDSKARLVICNRRYFQLYGLPPDPAPRGATLVELLRQRVANGTFSGDPEDYAETVLGTVARGRSLSQFFELADGRSIAELISPIPSGGWVTTHEDVTERREAERKIAHMARHDVLTDLPNRVLLRERLSEAIARLRGDRRVAVLSLDLDQFKNVNDAFGHAIGDHLLKIVAGRLREIISERDFVARVGGDEFAVIHTGALEPTAVAGLARRIIDAIKVPCDLAGHTYAIEASVGIAIAPTDAVAASDLLKNAELALFQVKLEGRGAFRFFEPGMDARMKARRALEIALRGALAAGEFELYYQPITDLGDRRITRCEALIRWNHPERGSISPGEFIPVAEEMGLIVPIGAWVIRQACLEASGWPSEVRLSVNLSPIQFQSPDLVEVVVAALTASGLPPAHLELEITESVLMQNTAATLAMLHRLRGLGVSISLDDFGTGYSSLSYLSSFPFDRIKIDRSFVNGLPHSDDAVAIVRAVTGLARSLHMSTTAEGVETAAQMEEARLLGCTEMQGYYFSRPVPAEEIGLILTGERIRLARSA